jgi:prepilin-type N-terminal cleavage/methylation domain-containing protein
VVTRRTGRGERGFTLMEVLVSLALFGMFVYIVALLTAEMRGYEKRLPVGFLSHPQVGAVIARLRKDVLDATKPYYPGSYQSYTQSEKTLILYSLQESGFAQTVVWDFSKPGEAHRLAYSAGALISDWVARGIPQFRVTDYPISDHPDSVRIQATDSKGTLAIDQLLQPRPHDPLIPPIAAP